MALQRSFFSYFVFAPSPCPNQEKILRTMASAMTTTCFAPAAVRPVVASSRPSRASFGRVAGLRAPLRCVEGSAAAAAKLVVRACNAAR